MAEGEFDEDSTDTERSREKNEIVLLIYLERDGNMKENKVLSVETEQKERKLKTKKGGIKKRTVIEHDILRERRMNIS